MKKNESKQDRFKRLAEKRVTNAAKSLKLVGNLGNQSLYTSSDAQRKEIIKYLEKTYKQMKKDLEKKTPKEEEDFKFGQ